MNDARSDVRSARKIGRSRRHTGFFKDSQLCKQQRIRVADEQVCADLMRPNAKGLLSSNLHPPD
jgi:hypothetical protein